MAQGRKVDALEAEELLATWECSGEPMSAWCAARGLNWYSLSAYKGWRRREPRLEFAEVVVQAPRASGTYRVLLGEYVIEVDDDFRADTLRRLIAVVCTC